MREGGRKGRKKGREVRMERGREGELAIIVEWGEHICKWPLCNSELTSLIMSALSMKPKESFSVFTNP